jgi:hypothetical protein
MFHLTLTYPQPPIPLPNLQAEANQVANDVMNTANGTVTPRTDTSRVVRSSNNSRPIPPIRTSSKTKVTEINNSSHTGARPIRSSVVRTLSSELNNSGDTDTSRGTSGSEAQTPLGKNHPNNVTRTDQIPDLQLPERRGRNNADSSEIPAAQSSSSNDENTRSESVVHVGRAEPIVKNKTKDRKI